MSSVRPAGPPLSSETMHGTSVARDGRAVLLTGASGSGKSDLALRLLDHGFVLISDDQTRINRQGDRLIASAPATIAGKLEIRGVGIVEISHVDDIPVALVVELTSDIERLPQNGRERSILGLRIPLVSIDAMTASAPAKVRIALERMGLT